MEGRGRVVSGLRHFFLSPTDMDGWASRILTVAVVLSIAFSYYLLVQVQYLAEISRSARISREQYQAQQTYRVCLLLKYQPLDQHERQAAQC